MPTGIYKRTPEHRAAISKGNLGRKVSAETRSKIASSQRGNKGQWWKVDGVGFQRGRAKIRMVSGWIIRARAIWVQHNGPIPKGYPIHHDDENELNDNIENLLCWTRVYHSQYHAKKGGYNLPISYKAGPRSIKTRGKVSVLQPS